MPPISVLEHTGFVNVVVRIAVHHEGKYLLVQENKAYVHGLWAFPGGKVDLDESLTAAAVREVKEETGLDVTLTHILGIRHNLWNDKPGFSLQINFLAIALSIPELHQANEEILAIQWKTLPEIEQLYKEGSLRNPAQQSILDQLISNEKLSISSLVEVSSAGPKL